MTRRARVPGASIGLRRPFLGALAELPPAQVTFWEVARENWIGVRGANGRRFRAMTERHPFVAHGPSLLIGSPAQVLSFGARLLQDLQARGVVLGTRRAASPRALA